VLSIYSQYKFMLTYTVSAGKDRESGLMVNDFARYSCIAYNSVGKSKLNYEIHLNVLCK